jgi:hypothetical protein
MIRGDFKIPPGLERRFVQSGIPEAHLIDLRLDIRRLARPPRSGEVELAIGSRAGDICRAAGDRAYQNAVLIRVENTPGMNQDDVYPFPKGEIDGDVIGSVIIIIPDPDPVLTVIVGAIDTKQAREIRSSD